MKPILLSLFLAATSTIALADPIGGPGSSCGTCFDSTYTLEYDPTPVSSTATTKTYRIYYTLDATTYNGAGVAVDELNFKVSSSYQSVALVSDPEPVGNWAVTGGNLSANGCSGSAAGFVCVDYTAGNGLAVPGGPYVWQFDLTVLNAVVPDTSSFGASIRARYVDINNRSQGVGITSEGITLQTRTVPSPSVPEPTAVVLSLSVAAIALHLGKKKFA